MCLCAAISLIQLHTHNDLMNEGKYYSIRVIPKEVIKVVRIGTGLPKMYCKISELTAKVV